MSQDWKHWEDLPPEREDELIEKVAQLIVNNRLGMIAKMLLESGGPITSLFAEFYMGLYGPYFDFFEVEEYGALLRKKSNIPRLIDKIEELEKENLN